MIIIAGHVHLAPADLEEFITEARATIPDALTEEGCLFLTFCVDDPATGSVVTLERWRSQHDIDLHLQKPAVRAIFTKWGPRMRSEVHKYDASNERAPL